MWEVTVSYKKGVEDAEGKSVSKALKLLGFEKVKDVRTAKVYRIAGSLTEKEVIEMCNKLLFNPVSQDFEIRKVREKKR